MMEISDEQYNTLQRLFPDCSVDVMSNPGGLTVVVQERPKGDGRPFAVGDVVENVWNGKRGKVDKAFTEKFGPEQVIFVVYADGTGTVMRAQHFRQTDPSDHANSIGGGIMPMTRRGAGEGSV